MASSRTVLTHARLLDGEHAARPNSVVVIDGPRVARSRTARSRRPDDHVVDLGGRTVMPGMATCHFHSTYHELGTVAAPYGLEEPPALQAVRAGKHLEDALAVVSPAWSVPAPRTASTPRCAGRSTQD